MTAAALPALVNGATRLYAIIGHPIAQVGSPAEMSARFRASGRNALMVPLDVEPSEFERTVAALKAIRNFDGFSVTIPFKARMLPFVDRVLPMAARVGAVNAMRRDGDGRWTGDMFDGRGLVRSLTAAGHRLRGCRALLIGTGGAGSAVAVALADAGAASIGLYDIDSEKAAALAQRIARHYPDCKAVAAEPDPAGADLVINATPIGMAPGDGMPVPLGRLDPKTLAVDVILKPEPTPFLRHAAACGCRTADGRAMFEGQLDEVIAFFAGNG